MNVEQIAHDCVTKMHDPEKIKGYLTGDALCPPTGKKAWVKDTYSLTVQGEKVSNMRMDSPADGGIPGALAQLGVKLPGM